MLNYKKFCKLKNSSLVKVKLKIVSSFHGIKLTDLEYENILDKVETLDYKELNQFLMKYNFQWFEAYCYKIRKNKKNLREALITYFKNKPLNVINEKYDTIEVIGKKVDSKIVTDKRSYFVNEFSIFNLEVL